MPRYKNGATKEDILRENIALREAMNEMLVRKGEKGDYILENELIERFGFNRGTLANYRSQGKLPYTKIRSRILYREADIITYLEENKIDKSKDNN